MTTSQLRKKREDFGATFTHQKMDMSFVLRITSSIGTDFVKKHTDVDEISGEMKIHRISPSVLKTSRFLEKEPAKKKTTLASPFLPQGKRNFLPKTSLRKF